MHALVLLAVLADMRVVRESLTGVHVREVPVHAHRVVVYEAPLRPFGYDYDPDTGNLLRRIPLYFNSKPARVFDPNPVVTLNDPTLQDQNDSASAVPGSAYRAVDLEAGDGPLHGPNVTMIGGPDASASLVFDRSADAFEDVNAYFHIDRNQRYLQSLGYTGPRQIVPYAIEVNANAVDAGDNSFFLPSPTRPGRGTLYFGEGGTDDAEDADLVVHEYGHAILEWIAPGTFTGAFASESRALAEGFGDYWAFSAHYAQRVDSGRDPFCFADWDARCWLDDPSQHCGYAPGTDCLRRLDSPLTMANYEFGDTSGVEHRNGAIWASALREIHVALTNEYGLVEGRRIADTLVIESLFDVPPHPTFAIMASRLLETDRLLHRGANVPLICAAMTARGILAQCGSAPRGEITSFRSSDRALPIPENDPNGIVSRLTIGDTRAIERLFVRVDIAHPSRGDLRIDLVAPNGANVLLQQVSFERSRDIHVTYGIDAAPAQSLDILRGMSAAGEWKLVVRDLRALDAGTLLSWGLDIQFAGDEPRNERPRGAHARMFPVVAHLFGVNATEFVSDVRIANPSSARREATLIFTRSGDDGTANFEAVNAVLEAGQTIAFDDVLGSVFHTTGSGTLEIIGDELVVMSRTYAKTPEGTIGQQVPANLETTALGASPLFAAPIGSRVLRANLGIAEPAGNAGVVRVRVGDTVTDLAIAPFSHIQFPIEPELVEVSVIEGAARVAAYVSQIDMTGDPLFIPAETAAIARRRIAPVISTDRWRSDALFSGDAALTLVDTTHHESLPAFASNAFYIGVVQHFWFRGNVLGALVADLPPGVVGWTRVATDLTSQFIPFLESGPAEQHLVFVESSDGYRTNIGIVSESAAVAEVVVYDAAGVEKERQMLATAGGIAQTAILARVTAGRAVVRFVAGSGRAYASLVDNATLDATFVAGQ